jgi:hypothetical protein
MKMYMDILEEWDDKIAEEGEAEDSCLRPGEWVDVNANDGSKGELKGLLETAFGEVTRFVYEIYENFLVKHWENEKIDYGLFTHEQLSDPSDSVQYSL